MTLLAIKLFDFGFALSVGPLSLEVFYRWRYRYIRIFRWRAKVRPPSLPWRKR